MNIRKYRVSNYTAKKFEFLITSAVLEIGVFVNLPQGELQIWKLGKTF